MNAVALNGQKRTLKNENIFIRKLVNEKLKIPPTKPFTILNFKNLGRTSLNYIKFEIEFIQRILRLSYCERFRRDVSFKRKAVFTIYLTWLAEDNYYCGLFSLIYIFSPFSAVVYFVNKVERKRDIIRPDRPFLNFGASKSGLNVPEQHKIRRSPDLEALKFLNERLGLGYEKKNVNNTQE